MTLATAMQRYSQWSDGFLRLLSAVASHIEKTRDPNRPSGPRDAFHSMWIMLSVMCSLATLAAMYLAATSSNGILLKGLTITMLLLPLSIWGLLIRLEHPQIVRFRFWGGLARSLGTVLLSALLVIVMEHSVGTQGIVRAMDYFLE